MALRSCRAWSPSAAVATVLLCTWRDSLLAAARPAVPSSDPVHVVSGGEAGVDVKELPAALPREKIERA
jgi:hypothetical protein